MNAEPLPAWARVVGTIPRLIALVLFAGAAAVGFMLIAECDDDWPAIGASALMAAWAFHWAMRLAIFHRMLPEATAVRLSKYAQAAGYAAAAAGFVGTAFRHGTDYVQWWPFFAGMLFVWAMAVCARDARSGTDVSQGL